MWITHTKVCMHLAPLWVFFSYSSFQAFSRLWLQLTSPMWVFASVLRSEVIEPLTATCPRSNIVESWTYIEVHLFLSSHNFFVESN